MRNDIKSLEKVLNIKFPNDYKKISLKTNGVIPNDNNNENIIKNIEKNYKYRYLSMELILTIHALILNTEKKYIDDLFEKTVIIGDSLKMDFIMICDGNNIYGVYYYDDSYYFDESNDEIYYISYQIILKYLTEFLDMIGWKR